MPIEDFLASFHESVIESLMDWRMYIWWSLCALYLLACQVRVTVGGDSGLCCLRLCDVLRALINSLYVENRKGLAVVTWRIALWNVDLTFIGSTPIKLLETIIGLERHLSRLSRARSPLGPVGKTRITQKSETRMTASVVNQDPNT